jgi:histidinol-phosphate/aromatic aminotransferase/cobyric acid decarboxylase-like protein
LTGRRSASIQGQPSTPGSRGPDLSAYLRPAPHGGDGVRLAVLLGVDPTEILDLSASLNPLAPDPATVLRAHLDALGRYPDDERATDAMAAALGVPEDRIVLTNGGAEAIALVAGETGAGWVEEPEFSLYRRHLPTLSPSAGRWRSNPRNPTGDLADPADVAAVWDEAFWPLATGTWSRGDAERGSIVLGSLTKLLACPGIRIGYVICPDSDLADRLRARQPRWSVNGLVCSALPDLLAGVDLEGWARGIGDLRRDLVGILTRNGIEVRAGSANWVLARAAWLRAALAVRGVAVRDCTSFGLPDWVRIAVPGPAGLERLESALNGEGCP